ncbi:response regulator [Aliarcobacter butzleri]|uniref:hypothetical protein n=1 Tax=Aliarcobacter butzleri TaxID=28197 RepID=UPI0021B24A4A|nr:hypothetical protein [Aliarcobacter butzleri]MCT7562073.1 hypothetical protein [Aliarcobacter butzleri]
MKILFIEDDDDKRKKIKNFLIEEFNNINIVDKNSYHGALLELVSGNTYDLVLMDMSMPNFDKTIDDPEGGSPESFAGRNLLEQMSFRNIIFPVIVITQFDSFGEIDKLSLKELKEELSDKFSPTYIDTVYYHSSESNWKQIVKNLITNCLGEKEDD